ncbi:MAG: hypothetical protein ACFFFB_18570 [Candidatus Heimdallarchaeota archaeon]
MLKLRSRRIKWFYPRVEVADLKRKIHFLEFENKSILEFLQKYLIIERRGKNNLDIPDTGEDISIFLYNQFVRNHDKKDLVFKNILVM